MTTLPSLEEFSSIELHRKLENLRVADLIKIKTDFNLTDVRTSKGKAVLVDDIVNSETLHNTETKDSIIKIADFFAQGGKATLSLYRIPAILPSDFSITNFRNTVNSLPKLKIKHMEHEFKFSNVTLLPVDHEDFLEISLTYPGPKRNFVDYNTGESEYTPAVFCRCIIRPSSNSTVLDIRCSSRMAENLAFSISKLIWGENAGLPLIQPIKIHLNSDLALKLKENFNARSFQIKISEADEIDDNGRLHPSSSDFKSESFDLYDNRENLGIVEAAQDLGHGLLFDVDFNDDLKESDCKIYLNFGSNQVTFIKQSSLGAYEAVINSIIES